VTAKKTADLWCSGTQQYYGEGPTYTPAMLEVLKLLQLRRGCEEETDAASASLLPARVLPPGSPIPLEVSMRPASPVATPPALRARRQLAAGSSKELARLNTFLSEPEPMRRTRSAGVPTFLHICFLTRQDW
jgi:hypothetical protein